MFGAKYLYNYEVISVIHNCVKPLNNLCDKNINIFNILNVYTADKSKPDISKLKLNNGIVVIVLYYFLMQFFTSFKLMFSVLTEQDEIVSSKWCSYPVLEIAFIAQTYFKIRYKFLDDDLNFRNYIQSSYIFIVVCFVNYGLLYLKSKWNNFSQLTLCTDYWRNFLEYSSFHHFILLSTFTYFKDNTRK